MVLNRKTTHFSGMYINNLNGKPLEVRYYESSDGSISSITFKYSKGRIFGITKEKIEKKVASGEWSKG